LQPDGLSGVGSPCYDSVSFQGLSPSAASLSSV